MFASNAFAAEEETWYRAPMLGVMTGYLYEPLKPYTIHEWEKGLGNKMDADRWVTDFKEAGATYLIFYDKWIDGFVFHDTKTTGYKTKRDFVREVADACHRGGLKLIFYYNAINDGNPEFDQWALLDRNGDPIVFGRTWPTRYQTLHSPFRKKSVEQFRELMTNYGRIDGVWFDIFEERLNTSSKWTAQGFQKMFGVPFDQATGTQLFEFNARTMAGYLDEVRRIAREHQPDCVFTCNVGAVQCERSVSGVWNKWIGTRLDYSSDEGHSFRANDRLARMAWVLDKPTEVGLLLCSSWFTPLEDKAPPASMTEKQAIAAAAIALCQGANVFMALTPDHSGVFGEDLQRAKAIGAWFRTTERVLKGARPFSDVGIVLGAPAADGPSLSGGGTPWRRYVGRPLGVIDQAFAVKNSLDRAGAFGHVLLATEGGGSWPESLDGYRAVILPERAPLDQVRADQLRQYVKQGGRLIAFGHASMTDALGVRRPQYVLADLFGARHEGEFDFPKPQALVKVETDSVYPEDPQNFAAEHVVDGLSTSWASDGKPMPHWAEITLAEPTNVAQVEVINRGGPYQIKDLDIEAHDGKDWKLIESVRDTTARTISVSLATPMRTDRIRVKILRELYQGQERQWADVEAIRVVDTTGRNHALNQLQPLPLTNLTPELQAAFEGLSVEFPPMALVLEPTTAKPLATMGKTGPPAILRNVYGKGDAILIATSEGAFKADDPFWTGLRRLIAGEPTLVSSDEARDRYRIILTEVDDARVLHVIDQTAGAAGFKPGELTISLNDNRLGNPSRISLVGDHKPLAAKRNTGQITFTLSPNPVASVEFR